MLSALAEGNKKEKKESRVLPGFFIFINLKKSRTNARLF
jgi:hypothetical protein